MGCFCANVEPEQNTDINSFQGAAVEELVAAALEHLAAFQNPLTVRTVVANKQSFHDTNHLHMPYFTLKDLVSGKLNTAEGIFLIQKWSDWTFIGIDFPLSTFLSDIHSETRWTPSLMRTIFTLPVWHLRSTTLFQSLLWDLKGLRTLHEVNAAAVTTISDQEEISAAFNTQLTVFSSR